MTARLACAIALWLAATSAFARFDASVDETTISVADTLTLTLRADGANLTGDPDFAALSKDFDVGGTQRSSQFRSINGHIAAWTTWTLSLKPKHSGDLVIPSLALGTDKSQSLSITVKDLDPQLKRSIARTVFFETAYEPTQVYVQSQLIVTRKLFYVNGAQLYGDMPDVPPVPGAMVRSLGEAEHATAVRDGRQYGMIEQRFAVFPERSGDLAIPSATVTGSIRLAADSGMGGRRVAVDVSSEPLTITVLPIPPEYPRDAPWLPATEVEVLEDWPGEPDRGLVTAQPSQRTLLVRVEGNAASAIPPLTNALPPSLKAYPEPPKLSDAHGRAGIVGTRTESVSLVATQPGALTLPEVRVTWWDTVHAQVRTAAVPARTVQVTGAATTTTKQPAPTQAAGAAPQAVAPTADAPQAPTTPTTATIVRWLAAALIVALASAGIAAWRILQKYAARRATRLDPRRDEARAYKTFRRACDGDDPRSIRVAFDAWLTKRYHAPLAEATRVFNRDPDAHAAVNALNAALYRRDASLQFDAAPLRRCVDATRLASTNSARPAEFPQLYPSL